MMIVVLIILISNKNKYEQITWRKNLNCTIKRNEDGRFRSNIEF